MLMKCPKVNCSGNLDYVEVLEVVNKFPIENATTNIESEPKEGETTLTVDYLQCDKCMSKQYDFELDAPRDEEGNYEPTLIIKLPEVTVESNVDRTHKVYVHRDLVEGAQHYATIKVDLDGNVETEYKQDRSEIVEMKLQEFYDGLPLFYGEPQTK